eukprot:10269739-Alexandrium_andersonii.AAC.1
MDPRIRVACLHVLTLTAWPFKFPGAPADTASVRIEGSECLTASLRQMTRARPSGKARGIAPVGTHA